VAGGGDDCGKDGTGAYSQEQEREVKDDG